MKISKPTNHKWSILRGGGKLPNANCDQTTKWHHQNGSEWIGMANFAQFTTFPILWNNQMQIVNTKLPNENIQTYQPQMIDSGGG